VALQRKKGFVKLCGIAIHFEGKGFITKWDGAEDSDIEPIKGGLSDSMKRAAYQWGIGRVLYSLDTVWVDIERRGKSYVIKDSERRKLDNCPQSGWRCRRAANPFFRWSATA